ncbi:MAG: indole-3-glycerol phosphate synthase TrpC [Eubacteriaceae bacterium]|nr:indole-3-glycerol phosphate synthase TrpC [Eubacteriaceae bacterium]
MSILNEIVVATKMRVEREKALGYQMMGLAKRGPYKFEKALRSDEMSFICEVKKASPSAGVISESFDHLQIAKEYEAAGATAISVLTEPEYFQGSDSYLTDIRLMSNLPLLRKDFIVDVFQIEQASLIGADAILLIAAILSEAAMKYFITAADAYGISCLVEAHDEQEIKEALRAGARVIGVNNRDLNTFEVDIENSIRLRKHVPKGIPFVSESGIKTSEDINRLRDAGVNAVLIGETLMKSDDKTKALRELKGIET